MGVEGDEKLTDNKEKNEKLTTRPRNEAKDSNFVEDLHQEPGKPTVRTGRDGDKKGENGKKRAKRTVETGSQAHKLTSSCQITSSIKQGENKKMRQRTGLDRR